MKRVRPVHFQPGVAGDPPLCFSFWPSEPVRHTFNAAEVTCTRCIRRLAHRVEAQLSAKVVVHLAKESTAGTFCGEVSDWVNPLVAPWDLTYMSNATHCPGDVTCPACRRLGGLP